MMTALDIYNDFNDNLVQKLPMDDACFLAALTKENLFPGDLKDKVKSQSTTKDKASYFLDNAIKPCSGDGDDVDIEPFLKLLKVMKKFNSDALKKLATKIWTKLSK